VIFGPSVPIVSWRATLEAAALTTLTQIQRNRVAAATCPLQRTHAARAPDRGREPLEGLPIEVSAAFR
jgi:hypothetical protein